MKKIILAMAALFLHAVCFAADFRVISDTKVYDGDYHYIGELKKGDIVQLFDCSATTDEKLDFAFTLLLNMNGKMRLVDLSTVIPNETSELFDERVRYTTLTTQGKNWIPVQNIDILRSRSRDRYYETYKNKLARYDEPDIFQISWHEHYKVRTAAQIENCFLYFTDEKNYAIFLYVKDIKPTGNGYMVSCEMFKSYTSDLFVEKNDFLENLTEKGQIVNLLLIFDGDYLHIYTEKKQRLFTYALMDSEYSTQMENLIRNETCDLSKVTWPRHADGTCDYDGNATAGAGDFEDRLNKGFWVRDYYNEVILTRDRNIILSYVPKYKESPSTFAYELDSEVYWYEESIFDKCEYVFSKIFYTYFLYVFSASFYITDIQRIDTDMYQVVVETDNFSKDEIEKSYNSGCDWQDENIIIERFYLKFDGDYLYVYLNEKTNLLATYCAYSESEYAWLNEAVATNDFDGMDFTFPRHADGSCDYDEGAWKSARKSGGGIPLRTGKAMTTKENLRVHVVEKTTSPVLITLAAGTPVEIIGVGGEETIDGITSKWVHVKVMPGTTGTDGRHMTGTMGGWCFGGLVSATEKEPESADAPATERAEFVVESAIPKPAPAVGKTAAVTENLRLRRDDDRTAEVVATLAAGTRVKVEAIGREDAIDGILSNWVRVSVLGGARDKDGNAVAAGTEGWLFGGYLSEAEDAESGSPNGETDAAKAPALPIVPIVASGAVLAVLLAAILLAVRKKKGGKE